MGAWALLTVLLLAAAPAAAVAGTAAGAAAPADSCPSAVGCQRGTTDAPVLLQVVSSKQRSLGNETHRFHMVVEKHCEDLSWINNIKPALRPHLRVFIYDKSGKDCKPVAAKDFPQDLHVTVEVLENVARDGHDQLYHISKHYDELALHTAFVQAGFHWTLKGLQGRGAKGWLSQAEALNDLFPKLSESVKFLPLTMYTKRGPVLWQDREDDTDPDFPEEVNVLKFNTGWSDMYNKGRDLYSVLFGGPPCQAKGQWFTAGMQYIVHRDNIRRRPREFWSHLKESLVHCDPEFGYVFERLTTSIYNSSAVALDPKQWREPVFCKRGLSWKMFTNPLDRMKTAEFWRKQWGCEPLSDRLLQMHAAGKI